MSFRGQFDQLLGDANFYQCSSAVLDRANNSRNGSAAQVNLPHLRTLWQLYLSKGHRTLKVLAGETLKGFCRFWALPAN